MIDRSMLAEIKQELKTELCAEIRNEELAAVWTQIAELREKCGLSASSNRFYYDYSDLSLYYSGTLPSQPQPSDQRGDGAAHLLLPSQPQPSDQRGDGAAHLLPPPRPPRFRRDAPQDPVDRGEGNNPDEQRKKLADREEGDVEEEEVELEASMWHMPLVVFGSGVPGAGASILSVLLLVTNIVIQCIFCYIVISSLSLPNILPETVGGAERVSGKRGLCRPRVPAPWFDIVNERVRTLTVVFPSCCRGCILEEMASGGRGGRGEQDSHLLEDVRDRWRGKKQEEGGAAGAARRKAVIYSKMFVTGGDLLEDVRDRWSSSRTGGGARRTASKTTTNFSSSRWRPACAPAMPRSTRQLRKRPFTQSSRC